MLIPNLLFIICSFIVISLVFSIIILIIQYLVGEIDSLWTCYRDASWKLIVFSIIGFTPLTMMILTLFIYPPKVYVVRGESADQLTYSSNVRIGTCYLDSIMPLENNEEYVLNKSECFLIDEPVKYSASKWRKYDDLPNPVFIEPGYLSQVPTPTLLFKEIPEKKMVRRGTGGLLQWYLRAATSSEIEFAFPEDSD